MKNLFKSTMLIAAAAMAFASCEKERIAEETDLRNNKIHLTIGADNPKAEDVTRTIVQDDKTPMWLPNDQIGVVADLTKSDHSAFTNDSSETGRKTTFSGDLEIEQEGETTIYSYYPYSGYVAGGAKDDGTFNFRADISTSQFPTATSFDGNSDILVGTPVTVNLVKDGKNTIDNFNFTRVSGVLKVALVDGTNGNILSGEQVNTFTFKYDDANIAGSLSLNLETGENKLYTNYSKEVTATHTPGNKYNIGEGSTYFCMYPVTFQANKNVNISVTTDKYIITREITVPNDFNVYAGKISTLSIKVTEANIKEASALDGDYVILANNNGTYYALSSDDASTNNNKRLTAKSYTYEGQGFVSLSDEEKDLCWCITKSENGYYTIVNNNQYLTSGNNAASVGNTKTELTISENPDGTYQIKKDSYTLSQNSGNSQFFAFYSGNNVGIRDLYIIPIKEYPVITYNTPNALPAAGGKDSFEFYVKDGTVSDSGIASYDDEQLTTPATWLSYTWDGNKTITYSAEENNGEIRHAYIVITATNSEGYSTVVIPITQESNITTAVQTEKTSFGAVNGAIDDIISYAADKGGSATPPAINSNEIRIYQMPNNGTVGGNITLTAKDGYKIRSVTIGSSMSTSVKYELEGNGTHLPNSAADITANGKYTVGDLTAQSITFHCYGTTTTSRLYVNYISVVYTNGDGDYEIGGGGTTDPDPEQPEQPEQPSGGVDVLDNAFTGRGTATSYDDWSGKGTSGAVYAGRSAGQYSSIQLRVSGSNEGVVTTTSGGKVAKMSVKWNSNTVAGRTLDVYCKNTAYESPADLFKAETQGTKVASFKYTEGNENQEFTINGEYTFIGFRSSASALYLDEVKITWE